MSSSIMEGALPAFRLYTEKSLTAVRGRNVSLPCNFSIPTIAVYWYKHNFTGAPDDEASLVARDYRGFTDPLPGFARFSITSDYSLVISNTTVHDETTYSCLVATQQTTDERGYTDLKVIALAEPLEPIITIIESCNITAPRKCTYYTTEEEINLVCELYNVRPPPDLIWILEGIVQENATDHIQKKDGLFNISSQLQVSKSDFEKQYICQAKGEAVNGTSSMTITIEVSELPGDITGSHYDRIIMIIISLVICLVLSCLLNLVLLVKFRRHIPCLRDSKQLVALNEMDEDDTGILVPIAGEGHQSQQGNYPDEGLKQKTPPALVYFRPFPILGEYQFYDGMSMPVEDIIKTFITTKLHPWNGRSEKWPNYSLGVCRITPHTDNDDGTRHKTKSVILGGGESCWRNRNQHTHTYMEMLEYIREKEFPSDAEIEIFLSYSPCDRCITELDELLPVYSRVEIRVSGLYYIRAPSCDTMQPLCKCIPNDETFRKLYDLGASPMRKEDWDELINLLTQYNKQRHEENEAHTLTDLNAIRYGDEYGEWRDWEDERMMKDYKEMRDKLIHGTPRPFEDLPRQRRARKNDGGREGNEDSKQLVALNEMDEDDTGILVPIAGERHQSQQGNYPDEGLKQKTPPALVYFRLIPILGEYQFYNGMSMSVGDIIRTFIITKLHPWKGRREAWPNYSLGVCFITPHTDNVDSTRHKTKSVISGRGETCLKNTNHDAHPYMVLLGNIREKEFPVDAEIKMFLSFSPCTKCITEMDALRSMFSKVEITFSGFNYIRTPSCDKIQPPCKCIPDNETFRMLFDLGASPMRNEDWDELINLLTQYDKQRHQENEAHTLTDLNAIRYGEEYREWRNWEDERMIEDYRIMHDKLIAHTPPRPDVQPLLARPSRVQQDDGEREGNEVHRKKLSF